MSTMCTGTRRAATCSVYLKSDLGPDGLYPWSRDSVRGFDRKRLPLHLGASARARYPTGARSSSGGLFHHLGLYSFSLKLSSRKSLS